MAETAFVPPFQPTSASSSSSRLLGRRAKTPWRPETQELLTRSRPWASFVLPGVCVCAALSRQCQRPLRHQRRATAQALSSSPGWNWKKLPSWGVASLGFVLVLVHRVILKEFRLQLPPARFTVFLHAAFFLILSQLLPPSKFPEEQNFKLVLVVGIVEFFGWAALQQVAVGGGLGVSAALLSGISLLVTLASAQLLLQSRVKASAWIGAAIVAAGVGVAGPVHALSTVSSHPSEICLICVALATTSLALTGKEVLFSGRAPLSVASVASLASFAQLFALALPEIFRLHSFPGTLQLAQIIIGPAPRIASLSAVAYIYILGSAFLRYTFTWALRTANAATVQLVNAVAVPFGSALLMLLSKTQLSAQGLAALGLCTMGSVIFFMEEGPLVKASELFKTSMSEEELKLEEAWQRDKAEKAKKKAAEREKREKENQAKEAAKQKAKELQAKQKEETKKKKEEEHQRKEEERLKAAAEKKRNQEEQKAKKEDDRKKAEEERRKKQEEYQRMKKEEEKKAMAEKQKKEAEKKQKEEEKKQQAEAKKKAQEEAQKEQERIAQQKRAEKAKKKQEEQQRKAEEAKKAQEIKEAEEERKKKEQEERKKQQEEEAARQKEALRQKQLEEEQKKQQIEAEKKQKQEEELKRKEEEDRKRKEQEEAKQKAETARKAEEERKQKEDAERKRKQEEDNRKQEEEQKRKAEEERKEEQKRKEQEAAIAAKQEEERQQKEQQEQETAKATEASEKDKKKQDKRYERLSFKWKVQDEMRLGQEAAKIKKQLQEREQELAKLRQSKEDDDRKWKELQAEAQKIDD